MNERQKKILDILEEKKVVSSKFLMENVFASEATIRRDLNLLEKKGYLSRTHGGAMLVDSLINETSVLLREQVSIKEKKAIAEKCLSFIVDGHSYFFDSSTTVGHLIPLLTKNHDLTVITNGINNALLLSSLKNVGVVLAGGNVSPKTNSTIGSHTIDFISSFNCNAFIFSCTGISLNGGITESNIEQALSKKVMLKNSKLHVLLVDHRKFDQTFVSKTCDLSDIDIIITNQKPSDAYAEVFRQLNIRLIISK